MPWNPAPCEACARVAPPELREIVENVLQERQVISWAHDDLVGLGALAACMALMRRCRQGSRLAS